MSQRPSAASWRGILCSVLTVLTLSAAPGHAEFQVVVSVNSAIPALKRGQVIDVFLGRHRPFGDHATPHPIDAPRGSRERRFFYRRLLDRSEEEIDAYRALLAFAGQSSPPPQIASQAELVAAIVADPWAIGYLDASALPSELKSVFVLPE